MNATGNWSSSSSNTALDPGGPVQYVWDPSWPVDCHTANDSNIIYYLAPIYEIVGPILLILCALSVIGNSAILLTGFYIRKKHLTPTLMFSLSLAGADAVAAAVMGVGIFVNNILFFNFEKVVQNKDCIALVVETYRLAAMVCSAFHFVLLAFNHWMGITKPLHYASRMTRRTAGFCIVAMWILPLIVFFAYFSLVPDQGFQSEDCLITDFAHCFTFRAFVSGLFFGPMALMSAFYLHVFYVIHQHQQKMYSMDVAGSSDEKRRMQSNTKALITTLIILLTYLIGWLPAVINYITVCVDCVVPLTISLCIRLPVNIIVNIVILLKFLVDPIIYTARIQEVRMVIQYFLARWGCRKLDDTQRPFSRFDTSRSGSLMTSLRYSTYRQRKESDSSQTLQRLSSQYSVNGYHANSTRRGPQLLNVMGNGAGNCVQRRPSTGSNSGNHIAPRCETVTSLRPVAVYPALTEVSESRLNHHGSDDSTAANSNGGYGTVARFL